MTQIINTTGEPKLLTNPRSRDNSDPSEPLMSTQVKTAASKQETLEYILYFFLALLEALLIFRFLLKLTAASQASSFVATIYAITGFFVMPFEGIFRKAYIDTASTTSVFEPALLVAMIVYALLFGGIVKLIKISSREKQNL